MYCHLIHALLKVGVLTLPTVDNKTAGALAPARSPGIESHRLDPVTGFL